MDPFEVRLQFLSLLSRLSSSLASIQKVSSFALKHGPKCGDDIWDCLIDECDQVNLNARINLLYFLDTLLDKQTTTTIQQPYKNLVKRDLAKIVDLVVPVTREGVLNLMSTNQVLKSWRTRRLLEAETLDPILLSLEGRKAIVHSAEPNKTTFSTFSHGDILRRIEDDRERHKRLRERIWVLPIATTLSSNLSNPLLNNQPLSALALPSFTSPSSPSSPSEVAAHLLQRTSKVAIKPTANSNSNDRMNIGGVGPELAIEIEFDQLWDNSQEEMDLILGLTTDKMEVDDESKISGIEWPLSEEDILAMRKERERCFTSLGN